MEVFSLLRLSALANNIFLLRFASAFLLLGSGLNRGQRPVEHKREILFVHTYVYLNICFFLSVHVSIYPPELTEPVPTSRLPQLSFTLTRLNQPLKVRHTNFAFNCSWCHSVSQYKGTPDLSMSLGDSFIFIFFQFLRFQTYKQGFGGGRFQSRFRRVRFRASASASTKMLLFY